MPSFPTYRGSLPARLRWWHPRHWLLLLYWIFFRPTALKCYLYQADARLYRTKPENWRAFLGLLRRHPAYGNL